MTDRLGRAWLLIGCVRGGICGDHAAWEEAAETCARRTTERQRWPTCDVPWQQLAAALYWGPTPVPRRDRALRGTPRRTTRLGHFGRASVDAVSSAGSIAQAGDFTERAPAHRRCSEQTSTDLGAYDPRGSTAEPIRAEVELLAGEFDCSGGDPALSSATYFERTRTSAHLLSAQPKLAEVLYRQGRFEEAEQWAGVAERMRRADDVSAQMVLDARSRRSSLARRGELCTRLASARRGDRAPRGRHATR